MNKEAEESTIIDVRFGGVGGQGIVLAGRLLGKAASLYDGKDAVVTQSYGPEARGGASRADVVISDTANYVTADKTGRTESLRNVSHGASYPGFELLDYDIDSGQTQHNALAPQANLFQNTLRRIHLRSCGVAIDSLLAIVRVPW